MGGAGEERPGMPPTRKHGRPGDLLLRSHCRRHGLEAPLPAMLELRSVPDPAGTRLKAVVGESSQPVMRHHQAGEAMVMVLVAAKRK